MDFYSLDPLHYYTTPGLAWDAALRMSRVDLQLITDENMYNFIENSIWGGISMISIRYAKANNPTIPDIYDYNLPNQNLIYLDTNNLYGWAMSQFLSTHGFRFISDDEITALKLEDLCDDDEDGYIYDVDLHYPTKLHDQHDDYPLAPESLVNNSVFGKTKENLRKRVQVDSITYANTLRKRVAKPSFGIGIPITDCLTVVQCKV